jgi:hypothetical protein
MAISINWMSETVAYITSLKGHECEETMRPKLETYQNVMDKKFHQLRAKVQQNDKEGYALIFEAIDKELTWLTERKDQLRCMQSANGLSKPGAGPKKKAKKAN